MRFVFWFFFFHYYLFHLLVQRNAHLNSRFSAGSVGLEHPVLIMFPIIPSSVRQKQRAPNSDSAVAICHSGRGWRDSDKHSWGDAGLSFSPGKRTFFFFFYFFSRHTGAAEYWSPSIKSGHMGVNYSSSEASPRGFASPGYCSPDLQYLMLPIFDAAASPQLGQSWRVST